MAIEYLHCRHGSFFFTSTLSLFAPCSWTAQIDPARCLLAFDGRATIGEAVPTLRTLGVNFSSIEAGMGTVR